MEAYDIDIYDCSEVEAHWEIQRADGETEMYTVWNETYYQEDMMTFQTEGLVFLDTILPLTAIYRWNSDPKT